MPAASPLPAEEESPQPKDASIPEETLHQPPPQPLPRLALGLLPRSATDPSEAMVANPELRDAAAMLLEGAQGCGSARNASPCKLPRASRSEMLEYDVEMQTAADGAFPDRRLTKESRIILRRDTQARLELLGPVRLPCQHAAAWRSLDTVGVPCMQHACPLPRKTVLTAPRNPPLARPGLQPACPPMPALSCCVA